MGIIMASPANVAVDPLGIFWSHELPSRPPTVTMAPSSSLDQVCIPLRLDVLRISSLNRHRSTANSPGVMEGPTGPVPTGTGSGRLSPLARQGGVRGSYLHTVVGTLCDGSPDPYP
ncbi:hypothetical protein AX16_001297 [Volvariella volvacea WC 439]|nr:hypothetical protein AX16_001297 [Volvariella volvacea WC 439]